MQKDEAAIRFDAAERARYRHTMRAADTYADREIGDFSYFLALRLGKTYTI